MQVIDVRVAAIDATDKHLWVQEEAGGMYSGIYWDADDFLHDVMALSDE